MISSVEEKALKRASLKAPTKEMILSEEGDKPGSLRKKLMQQIKRVAHHSRTDLKASTELESTRKEQFSLKQASNVYQEMLLLRSCQLMEQRSKLIGTADGFYVDAPGQFDGRINGARVEIEHTENDKMQYEKEFMPKEHYNFVGEDESNNIVAVSVVRRDSVTDFHALVRTELKDENLDIHRAYVPTLRRTISKQEIIDALKPKVSLRRLVKTDSPRVKENLIILEKAQCVQNYKFGVVYCANDQTDENDMFSNVDGSEKWNEFLEFLGNKITLKGWQGFSGGLDTNNNATGENAIFSSWGNFQSIFHVSTMLPFDSLDPQKLERKRHIGNDVVIIVFKESSLPYSPITITSHYIHIIIVVEPVEIEEKTFYRVEVACKNGVPPFGPQLTQPLFAKDDYFRNFLLTKLINGERAAYHAPAFRPKITRTRSQILKSCGEAINDKTNRLRNSGSINNSPSSPPKSPLRKPRGLASLFDKKPKKSGVL